MPIMGFEFEEIARMLALMEAGDLEEIEWEESDRYLKVGGVRSYRPTAAPAAVTAIVQSSPGSRLTQGTPRTEQKAIAPKASTGLAEDEIALVSPMVGVFYRSGKPGDPPLVEVGQIVQRDQPIGIIEAMKIFSEIPAEHAGIVVSVPAEDGQLVQAGTNLVILRVQA